MGRRGQRHGGRLRVDDDDTLRHSACIGHSEDGLREVKPGIRLVQRYLILGGKGRFVVVISVGFQGFELEPVGSGVFAGGIIQRGHEADAGMGVGGEATFRLLGVHTHGDGVGFGLVGRALCGEYIAHHEVGYLVLRVLSVQRRVLPVFYVEGDFEVVLVGIGDAHGVAVVVGDVEVERASVGLLLYEGHAVADGLRLGGIDAVESAYNKACLIGLRRRIAVESAFGEAFVGIFEGFERARGAGD